MDDDFYGDTISVELAIQRELTYRRNLSSQLKPNDDFLKDLIPFQSSNPGPIENQSSSGTVPLGAKRKEPSGAVQPQAIVPEMQKYFPEKQMQGLTTTSGHDLRCKLCNVECSSHFNLRQHLRGQKHQAKLEESAKGQRQWCQLCGVPCMNEECLRMHFQGKRHKAKVMEMGLSSSTMTAGGVGQSVEHVEAEQHRGVYCYMCRVWCADEGCFKQHLEGRKHKLNVYDHK